MEEYFDQIEAAVASGLYFVALAAILTVPDICGALGELDGRSTGDRYKAWVNANMAGCFPDGVPDGGEALWDFRCSMLHQHHAAPQNKPVRLLFTPPESALILEGNQAVTGGAEGGGTVAFFIAIGWFGGQVISAAKAWLIGRADDPVVRGNLGRLVQLHPDGVPPYVTGWPVYG